MERFTQLPRWTKPPVQFPSRSAAVAAKVRAGAPTARKNAHTRRTIRRDFMGGVLGERFVNSRAPILYYAPMPFSILLAAASLIAASIAAVVGFGIGSILTPVLALAVGTKLAVAAVAIPHF